MNYLYRYRSIDVLFKHKELENLSIYFAKPEELNDQMEKYMNVIWQGDEIAFQGLFKHYLYTLTHLYFSILLRKPKEKIDINNLPVFLDIKILEAPEMKDVFKSIYDEFFSVPDITQFPTQMASSNKKFTSDEILWIFQGINLYAYLVINYIIKLKIFKRDILEDPSLKETYNFLKKWVGYSQMLSILTNSHLSAKEVEHQRASFAIEQQGNKQIINTLFKNKDTHNINLLTFDFPQAYMKNINKILYNKYCVACFSGTYQNEPMWAHYANKENGICLQYKIKDVKGQPYFHLNWVVGVATNSTGYDVTREFQWVQTSKVEYSNDYPEIDFFKSLGMLPMAIINEFWLCNYEKTKFSTCLEAYKSDEDWREKYYENAKKYICAKSTNWEYEKEYRLFQQDLLTPVSDIKENRIANYAIEDLESIIFGRNVLTENKRKIIEIITNHCKGKKHRVKFLDLYYSTITKQLETKPCLEAQFLTI